MSDDEQVERDEAIEDESGLSRRELFLKGGLLGAGAAFLGSPVAALAAAGRGSAAEASSLRIAVITHGAGDAFWSVAKKGAQRAGRDLGVNVLYSESRNDPQRQASLITSAVSKKVKGIAVSAPNPSAIKDALARAKSAKIPVITLNSGVDKYKQLGALTHVGQTETIAGRAAGARLKASGAKNLLVVIHEQGNIGLEQRYSGAKSGFKGSTSRLQVAGVNDLAGTQNSIRSKLLASRKIDAVLTLNPQVATAAQQAIKAARSKAKLGTFDLSSDVIKAIRAGQMAFAIDQQQYLQGYLPVVFLYLYDYNLNTVGGGQPVLTGPGFVDRGNAARVAAYARRGTR